MPNSTITRVLNQLVDVTQVASGWRARCPMHDYVIFLSIAEAEDGSPLIACPEGCDQREILDALGLGPGDWLLRQARTKMNAAKNADSKRSLRRVGKRGSHSRKGRG